MINTDDRRRLALDLWGHERVSQALDAYRPQDMTSALLLRSQAELERGLVHYGQWAASLPPEQFAALVAVFTGAALESLFDQDADDQDAEPWPAGRPAVLCGDAHVQVSTDPARVTCPECQRLRVVRVVH